MADQDIEITISTKIDSLTAAVNTANRKIKELQDQAKQAGKSLDDLDRSGNGMHGTVSSVQAASGALRELNGDFTNNIRAVERLIASSPALSNALKAAFPIIGGVAFAGMLYEVTTKVIEFEKKMRDLPDKITQGFAELNNSARLSNDAIAISNDRLADQIAKLEHKPRNVLKDTLDEARDASDKLAESIGHSVKAVQDLIKENSVGVLGTFAGVAGTQDVEKALKGYAKRKQEVEVKLGNASDSGDTVAMTTHRAELSAIEAEEMQYAKAEYAKRSGTVSVATGLLGTSHKDVSYGAFHGGDQGANLAILAGVAQNDRINLQTPALDDEHTALTSRLKKDQNSAGADEQARKLAEAQHKADELRLKAIEDGLVQREQEYGKDVFATQAYWEAQRNAFAAGSSEYDAVQKDIYAAEEAARKQRSDLAKKAKEEAAKDSAELVRMGDLGDKMGKTQSEDVNHTGSRYSRFRAEQATEDTAPGKQALEQSKLKLAIEQSTGTISRYDAAQETLRIHTAEYTDTRAELLRQMADLPKQGLDSEQFQTQNKALNNSLGQLDGRHAVELASDNAAIDKTKLASAWRDSLNQFVTDSQDAAKQIGDIFTSTLGSVNGSLSTALTARYHTSHERNQALREGLSSDVRGAGSKLANYGLQKAEGLGLSKLGFGSKADGSSTNPWYVRVVNALSGAGSAVGSAGSTTNSAINKAGGWFSKLLGGIGGGPSTLSTGGADPLGLTAPGAVDASTAFGTGFGSLPAFANGGNIMADRPAMIGERGPEIFVPHSAGRIIPNDKIGGGGMTVHVSPNIDARGSTDPAAVHAAATRAVRDAAPQIVQAAISAHINRNQRVPTSQRK